MNRVKKTIKPEMVRIHPVGNGVQKLYRFDNGYGASVVRFKIGTSDTYGSYTDDESEWELGVIKWDGDDYELTYETSVTDDVMGYLTDEDVERTLLEISKLSKHKEV